MYLNEWMKKWFVAILICLFLIVGCGTYLFVNSLDKNSNPETSYVINQVRIKVNDLLLYIEQHYSDFTHDSNSRNTLQMMSIEQRVDILFTELDGKVSFNSSKDDPVSYIDIKNDLHYDLYTSKIEGNMFKIAFPVLDEKTQTQVGNAIFTIDKNSILTETSHFSNNFSIMIVMISLSIILIGFLCMIIYKCKVDIIRPIKKLKKSTEEILKGNYEQRTEYTRNDEVGEVYAVFDQMRIEIMELSIQRDEQEKDQKSLISNISHDIKTPLTTLKAYLDAIHDGVCPNMESVMEYIRIMQTNTEKMSRLIDDLLIHSLKELDHIPVYPKEQYSEEILSSIIQPISHYVRTTGVNFIGPSEIPNVLMKVDEHRLEQVISNIITNSLKHTSPGNSISISIDVEDNLLQIRITDTGEGILPQDMPFIFERYFRGNINPEKAVIKNEGSGLGLSICKHIMEAHDGSIAFKSKKNEGTAFTLLLPLS